MTYHTDPQGCFEHAIFEGVLSDDPRADNFAGRYMYMGTDEVADLFKHRETRRYVRSPLVC